MTKTILLLSSLLLFAAPSYAENWAHWRGPIGNGATTEGNPPTTWSETENVKWKVEVPGRGSGSPVVWQDRVFVVTAIPVEDNPNPEANNEETPDRKSAAPPKLKFAIIAYNRADGNVLWEQIAIEATPHQGTHATNSYASASPCTDGKHVYASFGSRGLYCYTMDGELAWKRDDLGEMKMMFSFGEGSSPTLADDKIIVPWDHQEQSYLIALDKLTGETIWKVQRDEPSCWATPLVIEHDGQKQVVMNGQKSARSYDLETGKELWWCGGQTMRPVASPVAASGLVYIGSGFRGAFMGAFRPGGHGDIEGSTNVVWTIDRDTPDVASPLLSNGRIYFYKGKSGMLTCIDAATGKPHYSAKRIPDIRSTYASPVAAGGHVYLTDRSGTTVVINDADELKIIATNSVDETVDATPAPVDNELFIRGEKHLFCIAQ